MMPVLTLSAALAGPARAQDSQDGSVLLAPINVEGAADERNVLMDKPSVHRIPTTVQDTPQVINVIPEAVIEERQSIGLKDIVRGVPGITLNAGEGGGGSQPGDNFNIRGFSANGNIYTDGLSNIGIYNRDAFNLEAVEVFKGPSGSTFGRGGGGGTINLQTKTPKAGTFGDIETTAGTDDYLRGTVDLNVPLSEDIGFRLNGMGLTRDVAGRDEVYSQRWAVAPSITFGMRSDTSLTLDYLHQTEDNRYDNGVPYAFGNELFDGGTSPLPVTEHGVDRDNFYGYSDNFEAVEADVVTGRFEHRFNDTFTLWNATRAGRVSHQRDYVALTSGAGSWAPDGCIGVDIDDCFLNIQSGGRGGGTLHYARDKEVWMFENQATLGADFETGSLSHQLRATAGFLWEDHDQQNFQLEGLAPNLDLLDPDFGSSGQDKVETTSLETKIHSPSVALYDRVGLGGGFYFIGNVRYERYSLDTKTLDAAGNETDASDDTLGLWTYQAAIEYKPEQNQTYYISFASSQLPLYDANLDYSSSPDAEDEPEESRIIEIGAKHSLLGGQLGLGASLFHIERTNMRVENETQDGVDVLDGKRVVDGLELQADGRITDQLSINLGYAFLKSEVDDPSSPDDGNEMMRTPKHSASAWVVYSPLEEVKLGAGATYVGRRYTSEDNSRYMPSQWQFDAMASYQLTENVGLQFNAINLTDELTYDGTHTVRHVQPGIGRTFLLSTRFSF